MSQFRARSLQHHVCTQGRGVSTQPTSMQHASNQRVEAGATATALSTRHRPRLAPAATRSIDRSDVPVHRTLSYRLVHRSNADTYTCMYARTEWAGGGGRSAPQPRRPPSCCAVVGMWVDVWSRVSGVCNVDGGGGRSMRARYRACMDARRPAGLLAAKEARERE